MGIAISLLNVRRSILIQAAPERVWREFQSFDSIGAWFGRGHQLHTFEPRLNGHVAIFHGFERLGVDAADNLQGYEEGWDLKHLKALRAIVEG